MLWRFWVELARPGCDTFLLSLHMYTYTVGDAEWKSVAYGAPCIQLTKETTDPNSPFSIKIVIAEVESGTSVSPPPSHSRRSDYLCPCRHLSVGGGSGCSQWLPCHAKQLPHLQEQREDLRHSVCQVSYRPALNCATVTTATTSLCVGVCTIGTCV